MPQAKGLLRVQGTLDVTQFWPVGESDADTVKVVVNKIEFSPDRTAHLPFAVVHIFDNAFVKGAQGPPKAPIKKGKLTIRLQGVDATELHFSATLPKKGLLHNGTRYRQHLGESASVKLHDIISSTSKKNPIPCEVVTFVDHPNDVFDMYGRMVGDVLVSTGSTQVNINQGLAENGWAFPTFYNSMSATEITTLAGLAATARKAKKGVWQHLSNDAAHPDTSLEFRAPGTKPKPKSDTGDTIMPKLFRRQIRYFVSALNHLFTGSVADFLLSQKDPWAKTADFLKNPNVKPTSKTGNLGVLLDKKGQFTVAPGDIVFFEKPSTLVDAKGNKITQWK
jgi:endonuclease YncB( thermonuclease family)